MKPYTKFEYDDEIASDGEPLKDGQSLRVSVALMDSAARRPSQPAARQMADTSGPAMADARERARLSMAWRGNVSDAEIENEARRRLQTRQADADTLARLEAVHDARDDALQTAWQR